MKRSALGALWTRRAENAVRRVRRVPVSLGARWRALRADLPGSGWRRLGRRELEMTISKTGCPEHKAGAGAMRLGHGDFARAWLRGDTPARGSGLKDKLGTPIVQQRVPGIDETALHALPGLVGDVVFEVDHHLGAAAFPLPDRDVRAPEHLRRFRRADRRSGPHFVRVPDGGADEASLVGGGPPRPATTTVGLIEQADCIMQSEQPRLRPRAVHPCP